MKAFLKGSEIKFDVKEKTWYFEGNVVTFPLTTEDSLFLKHDFQKAVTRLVKREIGEEAAQAVQFK
jgi:hypothetical protein